MPELRPKINEGTMVKTFIPQQLKIDADGIFSAVFATMNVIDHDRDMTLNGAFGSQKVIVSQYNHGSWSEGAKALPIGVGTIREQGDLAIIDGEFNIGNDDGKKTYETIKWLDSKGQAQEWSYALPEIDYEFREIDGESIRILKRIKVGEVSPVIMGAGIDTRLLSIKSKDTKALKLADHISELKLGVDALVERLKEIKTLRDAKGKNISETTIENVIVLADSFIAVAKELKRLDPARRDEAVHEYLRFVKNNVIALEE